MYEIHIVKTGKSSNDPWEMRNHIHGLCNCLACCLRGFLGSGKGEGIPGETSRLAGSRMSCKHHQKLTQG